MQSIGWIQQNATELSDFRTFVLLPPLSAVTAQPHDFVGDNSLRWIETGDIWSLAVDNTNVYAASKNDLIVISLSDLESD